MHTPTNTCTHEQTHTHTHAQTCAHKNVHTKEVIFSQDGIVRSCVVSYRLPKNTDKLDQYTGGRLIKIRRSIQRLTLLLRKEDQDEKLVVDDGQVVPENSSK